MNENNPDNWISFIYSMCETLGDVASRQSPGSKESDAIKFGGIALQFAAQKHVQEFQEYCREFRMPLTDDQINKLKQMGIDPDDQDQLDT